MCIKYFKNPVKTISKDIKKIEQNPASIIGDVVDVATAIYAPELLPIVAPTVGAATGAISDPKDPFGGALRGGAEGFVAGQIGGTGDYAPLSEGSTSFGQGLLNQAGDAFSSFGNDVGDALGLTSNTGSTAGNISSSDIGGFQNAPDIAPASAVSVGGSSPSTGIDSLNSDSIDKVLNNTSGATPTSGTGSLSSGNGLNFGNSIASTGAEVGKSYGVDTSLEAGGGFNYDSSLNSSIASPNASSASLFSSAPTLEAGGGIQASTGVAPVANQSLLGQAGDLLKQAKPLAPAASLAYQALSGPPKLPAAEQALLNSDTALQQQGQQEYTSGVLSGPQQAQLDTARQNAQNQLYQQFASMGISNPQQDTRFQQGMQQIEQQMEAQKQGFLDSSLNAAKGAGEQINQIAQLQMKNDESFSNEIEGASKALFDLLGS